MYTDLVHRKVYNWLTFPAMGIGFGMAFGEAFFYESNVPIWTCLSTVAVAFFVFVLPTYLAWLGPGDFKLFLAIGALLAPSMGVPTMLDGIYNTTLVGAVLAVLMLVWKGGLLSSLQGSFRLLLRPKQGPRPESQHMPYAVAIALGFGVTLWFHLQDFA